MLDKYFAKRFTKSKEDVCYIFYKSFLFQVPELAGFWLLTLVLQLPLLVFLLAASGGKPTPAEIGVHIIFLIFLLSEIVVGFFALKVMSRQQVMKFHLQEFDDILNPNRDQSESSRYEPLR